MDVQWDYTKLADAYLARPPYSKTTLQEIFSGAGLKKGDKVCDVGAGVAHMTIPLFEAGFIVDAVEPNDAMRANGIIRTKDMPGVSWSDGTGENTGRPSGVYDLVSFGSSFNVCDRELALKETYRLLKPEKWFCCLWNHRVLTDPIQAGIEKIIVDAIPNYDYGKRREEQDAIIVASGLFVEIRRIEGTVIHTQTTKEVVEAWRSHATLQRQAGDKFNGIIQQIDAYLAALGTSSIDIPYVTRAWMARRKD